MNLSNTEMEMLQTEKICLEFDLELTKQLAQEIGNKRIIFTGMGSSLIFPGKQAKNRSLKFNINNKIEVFFATDLFQYDDFSDTYVFLCSNSGKTKEVILLLDYVKSRGAKCVGVTAVADSILAQRADQKIILNGGFEKGVAATKSVVEQALVYDSLIFNLAILQGKPVDLIKIKEELIKTATLIKNNVNVKLDEKTIKILINSENYYMVGLDNGVAEEITLKAYEIAGKMAIFYPDTHIVHGVAEAIDGNCALIFGLDNFKEYWSDFEKFNQKTNCALVGVEAEINETFSNYCLLAAGWGILRNVGNRLNLDMDHPKKASKVGNPFEG